MKKFYLTKTAILAAAFLALVVASCGLIIQSIEVKSDVKTGEEFVMTINLDKDRSDNGYANNTNLYLYWGVRIPESWEATKLVGEDTGVNATTDDNTFTFEASEAYAKVLEYCYPCNVGYKWVAFQSIKQYDVNSDEGVKASVTLVAGNVEGEFKLDVMGGGTPYLAPSDLLTAAGEVNINKVFGNDIKGNPSGFGGLDTPTTFKPSEYIMNFGTIAQDEINARNTYFASRGVTATVGDKTLPIECENPNIYNKPVNVTVTKSTGIESVATDSSVEVNAGEGCVNVSADGVVTATVYNVAGRMIDTKVVDGEAALRAEKGVCLVEVVKAGKKIVRKVVVK